MFMKKTLIDILVRWLQDNQGFHAKGALLEMDWKYENSRKSYNKDTIARKLREATERGLILADHDSHGNTIYRSAGLPPKKAEYEVQMRDGMPVAVLINQL
jgi:hypothetical protein